MTAPLTIDQLVNPQTPDQFVTKILSVAAGLQLPTTSWQAGDPTPTIINVLGQMLGVAFGSAPTSQSSTADGLAVTIAMSGFLDYAAQVTLDPIVSNADGTYPVGGWLDILASSVYNVTRNPATYAAASVTVTNSTSSSYGPFAPGTYHLAQVSSGVTKATYTNQAALTIAPNTTTVFTAIADLPGPVGSAGANAISTLITALVGVSVTSSLQAVGALAQSNASLVAQCRAKLASFATKTGPTSAFVYFATATAEPGYPTATSSPSLSTPITRAAVIGDKSSGQVTVYLANAAGAPPAGDVTTMQTYLQNACTSDVESMSTAAAPAVTINATMTVYVPQQYNSAASAAVTSAFQNFINSLPLGGVTDENGTANTVPFGGVTDAIVEAVPYIRTSKLTLNGGTLSIPLTTAQVAIPGPIAVTVVSP